MTLGALPRLGLGTAALGMAPESTARATIGRALECGLRYFDTAPLYGGGLAEERLGRALKVGPSDVLVSTKCGRTRNRGAAPPGSGDAPDRWDFSEAATRASVAQSAERLYRDHLDIVFLHDIEAAPEQALNEALPTLRDLQAKGVIGLIGAGCNTVGGLTRALDAEASDVLLVAGRWTLLDRTAGQDLLPRADALGTRVVCGGVLNSGLLADPMATGARFDYRPATESERATARRLASLAEAEDASLLAAAFQFPGRDPRISTTLMGAASPEELDSALAAMATSVPAAFWNGVANEGIVA